MNQIKKAKQKKKKKKKRNKKKRLWVKVLKMHRIKKNYILFSKYKMFEITEETLEKQCRRNSTYGIKWLNERHIKDGLGYGSLPVLTKKYHLDYRKHRYELVNEPKKQPNIIFLHEDLAVKIVMVCRTSES